MASTKDGDFLIKLSRKRTPYQIFQCKGCASFKDKDRFKNHILGLHNYKFFHCVYCSKLVIFDGIEDHSLYCRKIRSYEPNFKSVYEAQYRIVLSHTSKGYYISVNILPAKEKVDHICELCDSLFAQRSHIEGHICYIHAFENITCTTCEKDTQVSNINDHISCQSSTNLNILFKVRSVKFFFSLRSSGNYPTLVLQALHNEVGIKLPLCEICKETFNTFELFTEHVGDHHNTDRFKCLSCLRISTFSSLEDHVISKHRSIKNELKFEAIFNSKLKNLNKPKYGVSLFFSTIGKSQCRDIFSVMISVRNDNWTTCRCVICKLDFRLIDEWFHHIYGEHDSFKFYTCTSCLTVCQLNNLRAHVCNKSDGHSMTFRSGKRQYSIIRPVTSDQLYVKIQERNISQCDNFCFVCKSNTDDEDKDILRNHLKYKHKMKYFVCNHCLEPVLFEKFDEHILLRHNVLNQVVCCLMQCFKNPPGVQCTNYSLIMFEGLRLIVNIENKIEYNCSLCQCKFGIRPSFQRHLGTTHKIHFFKCIQCNTTISFFGLEEHIASQHDFNDASTLFLCVTPGGLKVNSYLEQKICFTDEYVDPTVLVSFVETIEKRNGKLFLNNTSWHALA